MSLFLRYKLLCLVGWPLWQMQVLWNDVLCLPAIKEYSKSILLVKSRGGPERVLRFVSPSRSTLVTDTYLPARILCDLLVAGADGLTYRSLANVVHEAQAVRLRTLLQE